jgi:catechol 2,3-dioxygenase-like lactoylglutathione lyase family enzyme
MKMKLEVVVVPVTDVDRAIRFYNQLGWRQDSDYTVGDEFRIAQLTPPYSQCSIIIGRGITSDAPGSLRGMQLTVEDIVEARAELVRRGVEVSEVFHDVGKGHVGRYLEEGDSRRASGPDPDRGSYLSFATFSDPDGNRWVLQEVTTRLPGRLWED